jgi:hypothetical protein
MQKRSPDYLDERAGLQVLSRRAGPRQGASARIYITPASSKRGEHSAGPAPSSALTLLAA